MRMCRIQRFMHPSQQVHLSHNRITIEGARALLRSVPIAELDRGEGGRKARSNPPALWLRLEWNVIDLDALDKV